MAIATDNFLSAWLPSGRDAATLVKVELTDPSALTLYLSNREVTTGNEDGNPSSTPRFWQGALSDVGSVIEPGSLMSYDPELATFDFRLSGRPLRGQSPGSDDSALELLASHYWYGATVTVWWWEMGLASFTDALQIFKGVVIEFETESNTARVYCQQRNSWVVRVPAQEVTRAKYPRAPEKAIGAAIPICYGKMLTPPARWPSSEYGAFNQTLTGLIGVRRAGVRGVPVSLGKGDGAKGKVIFAGHACKTFNSDAAGATPALPFDDRLCEIDPIGGDVFNAADGTGFSFDDVTTADVDPFDCFFPVLALDSKQVASNPGDNARAAINAFDDTSYARLDYDAGERELKFILGDVSPPGLFRRMQLVLCWSTSPGATALRADFVTPAVGGTTATLAATAGLTTPTGAGTTVTAGAGGLPNGIWTLGSEGSYITVYLTGVATGQKARIYVVGVIYKFRPQWPVATPSRTYIVGYRKVPKKKGLFFNPLNTSDMYTTAPVYKTDPEEQIVDAQFFSTLEGYADDGGGTYTGAANALIQRPPDILRHFLATYCSETLLETASSNPGDLEDLRDALKTWRASDMVAAFSVDDFKMSSDVVRELASDTMCWFFISCFTNKWCGVPWKAGRAVDFPRRITRYDIVEVDGPKIIMHRDEVMNDLKIGYGFDAWSRRTIHETHCGPNRSGSGDKWRSIRDERITVVASESDRLDFTDSGGAHAAVLTAATYASGIAFAQHLQAQMRAVATDEFSVSYGYEVVANFNDDLDFNDGSVKLVTLDAGSYTGETLASHVQTKLNAASSNWTCTYSRTTRKFTISRSAGGDDVLFGSGANAGTSCAALMGYARVDYTLNPHASGVETEEDLFTITADVAFTLTFETGANGIDAATPRACGMLIGADMARDTDSAAVFTGHSPKGVREHDCATSVARYGARPEVVVDLRCVNDSDTAREVRNRMLDLWKQPPVEIQFTTERMPDLQRGMVFDFNATLDEVKPYSVPGSDGSWLGKKFVAVRVERRTYPTPHEFVVAFEVPAV